jgi:hypothetical protein
VVGRAAKLACPRSRVHRLILGKFSRLVLQLGDLVGLFGRFNFISRAGLSPMKRWLSLT